MARQNQTPYLDESNVHLLKAYCDSYPTKHFAETKLVYDQVAAPE